MKKALFKDSIKEIKNTYKRFISILLMAFLGVGFFAGLRATSPDMLNTIDKYYKEQNVYDIQIVSTLGLTKTDIEELAKIDKVEEVQGTYETDGKIGIDNKEIITKVITIEEINKPVLLSGNMPEKANECLVEKNFLTANKKQIGDTIQVEIEDSSTDKGEKISYLKEKELKIVGTVQSPLYISRDRGTSKLGAGKLNYYIYILKDNVNASDIYTNIYIKVKEAQNYTTSSDKYEDKIEQVKNKIETIKEAREQARYNDLVEKAEEKLQEAEEKLSKNKQEFEEQIVDGQKELQDSKEKFLEIEKPTWYILDRNANAGYVSFIQDTHSIENISKVFPVVFFIVATLISLTSMTRMVEEQRQQIGTLKALGYSKLQIMSKYIIYAGLACIIGSILGMSVGFVLLPNIIWLMYGMMYQITDSVLINFNLKYGGIGLILISICIIGATIYTALKELINTPSVLMRPKAPKSGNRVILEKIPFIWKKLNFSQKVTVRNIFRYKKRFFMTIIGIFGCTALILTGFGIKDSVLRIIPNQYGSVFQYDMQINLKDSLDNYQKQELISKIEQKQEIQKTAQVYMTSSTATNGQNSEEVQIIVPKDEKNLEGIINLKDIKNKKQKVELKENEICLTDKVAQLLNVKVGDSLTLKNSDQKEIKIKISNIVENYFSHYVYMSKQTYENFYHKDFETNVVFIQNIELNEEEQDGLAAEIMNMTEVSGITNMETTVKTMSDMMSLLNYVVIVLIVAAGLLAFVVLYNLANVNISERIRELATIKVLGFYDKEVYNYVTRETIILTMIGIVLGLIGGYFLNYYIMGTCEVNMIRFDKTIKWISYLYAVILTIVFTAIVNIATYFSLKKIDMIESLKSVE